MDYLLGGIEKKANDLTTAALQDGDTNFDKGQVAALRWVLKQPEELATKP
ncbi:MAG: hypothetical protein IIC66_10160 [candidate division Zixibacteria bacterium]|nr:hypothetical protein [candidate division Zixibacteria bacterium]